MLFNSFGYLVFLPCVVALFWVLPLAYRWWFLLLASCGFYMAFVLVYIGILGAIVIIDFYVGLKIDSCEAPRARRRWLLVSIAANVVILFSFKYLDWYLSLVAGPLSLPTWQLGLMLPLGLSFHVFQSLAYTVDVYRRHTPVEKHLGRFALYVLIFPQMVAGPIERPQHLLPQLWRPSNANNAVSTSNNGTVNAGCTLTADRNGNINRAYDFNGTANGTINLGDITAMNGANVLSISGWFKRTNINRNNEFYSKVIDSSGIYCRDYLQSNYTYNTFGNNTPAISPINTNWFHYTMTFSGGAMKVFVNGTLAAQFSNFAKPSIQSATGSSFILGDILRGGTTAYPSDNFIGQMDEINIFSKELNPVEIAALMNAPQFTQHPQNASLCAGNNLPLKTRYFPKE